MPRSSVSLKEGTVQAIKEAMEHAEALEGVQFDSIAEFVRDALRKRIQAINEAWRQVHSTRSNLGLPEPRKSQKP